MSKDFPILAYYILIELLYILAISRIFKTLLSIRYINCKELFLQKFCKFYYIYVFKCSQNILLQVFPCQSL